MPKAGKTHDIVISDKSSGSPSKGFMLARQPGQRGKGFRVHDFQTIAPRVMSDAELTYAQLNPAVESIWFQEDWSLGGGQGRHAASPGTSWLPFGVDTSRPGKARLIGEMTASATTANPTANTPVGGFATVGTEVWAFIERDVYTWNYTDEDWDKGALPENGAKLYRNGVKFEGNTFVPAWDTTKDNPATYIYKADADNDWTPSTLTLGANKYKYLAQTVESDGVTRFWGGNTVSTVDSTEDVNEGGGVDSSQTTFDVDDGSAFAEQDIIAIDAEYMLVTGISGNTLTVTRAYQGTVAASHADNASVFDVTLRPHQIRSSADPTNSGSWSSLVNIGTIDSAITAIVPDGNALLVFKTDGIYAYYREAGIVELLFNMSAFADADNFRGAINWQGHIIAPMPNGKLFELVGSTLVPIHQELKEMVEGIASLIADITQGGTTTLTEIVAVAGSEDTLYLMLNLSGSTVPWIVGGQYVGNKWRWTTFTAADNSFNVTEHGILFAEGIPSGGTGHHRLWIGAKQGGTNRPEFLPLSDSDQGWEFEYSAGAYLATTTYDANLPRVNKHFTNITFRGTFSANHYIEVKYRTNVASDSSFAYIGADAAASRITADDTTISFPSETTGKDIQLQIFFVKDGSANKKSTAELDSFSLRAQVRPAALKSLPLTVYLADGQRLISGGRQSTVKGDLNQLRAWNAQAAEVAVAVQDDDVTAYDMVFMPGTLQITEVARRRGRRGEYAASFLLVEA